MYQNTYALKSILKLLTSDENRRATANQAAKPKRGAALVTWRAKSLACVLAQHCPD